MKKDLFKHLLMGAGGIAVMAGLVWVVMLLWNAILPELTGWNEIGFWQCAGLCVMFRLMTGHIGISYHNGRKHRNRRHLHETLRHRYSAGNDKAGLEVKVFSVEKADGND
ncbi:MAG: hypothetical protein K2J66_04825 [Muribaculaceae bacterium]|nr:hypothetical protein [Muribaculaceae bacterium]